MSKSYPKVTPRCRHCKAKVWRVDSGLVCDECASKIVPVPLAMEQSFLPLDLSSVGVIKSRLRSRHGRQPESLFEQNSRLAHHGERQRTLFDAS